MKCHQCKWYKGHKWYKVIKTIKRPWYMFDEDITEIDYTKRGECHRNMPSIEKVKKDVDDGVHYSIQHIAYWPTVKGDDFCGGFEPI